MKSVPLDYVLVPLIAVVATLLANLIGRVARIPLVVFEIVLGLVVGPAVLGWVQPGVFTNTLSNLGLAMLFFMAGNEIDFAAIRGRSLRRAGIGWLISIVAGTALGIGLAPSPTTGVFVGIALASTALGTILPILRDEGELATPFGRAVTAVGAVGEFGPLLAISLFLSGRQPGVAAIVLIIFAIVALGAVWFAWRENSSGLHRLVTATLHSSGQFAIRLVILILGALVTLSLALGLDMLLGAFAAGVISRLLLADAAPADREAVESKLEAVAFGFLIPIFFIFTGVTFDLRALISSPRTLLLVPVFLVLLLVVRGLPNLLAAPAGSSWSDRRAIVLLGATGLPIIVAVTNIGRQTHLLSAGIAAALVGAGMLSVLLFPLIALLQRRPARPPRTPAAVTSTGDSD